MKIRTIGIIVAWTHLAVLSLPQGAFGQDSLRLAGLEQPVEIIKDRWGISHIYAETERDLFFAQGYNAAKDRLFQLEMWRRQATGTVSEILGPRELERDIGARLFMFRRDLDQELAYYHPRGRSIVEAFVAGVNAYIGETEKNPDLLPLEFGLLGLTPQPWTPEIVISRHQGLLGNITAELTYGRAVARLGDDTVIDLSNFHPGEPDVALDPAINGEALFDDILKLYNAFRGSVRFLPEDIVTSAAADAEEMAARLHEIVTPDVLNEDLENIGSNNWLVSGRLSASGFPIMANDPHRAIGAPALRYWVHLVGPGWNVIGGGEPSLPGVSIGHNEYGAWGLTVFRTDGEDLMVYETNPQNPNQYRYRGNWETMSIIEETIPVKGRAPASVELKYTRHGPVVHEDPERNLAYAVRAAWMELGGAPYLASLRMDQATNWEEFREACSFSNIPGENMIWAGRDGTIGWQAVGIAPIRPNWSGLVPVPGDGRYEWDGYLPIEAKPHVVNPAEGFFVTANNNLTSENFPYRNAIGWEWTEPFRWARISEFLANGRRHSLMDMMQLQTDELSIPARTLVPLLEHVRSSNRPVENARGLLLQWDYVMSVDSRAAPLYVAWERRLRSNMNETFVPEGGEGLVSVSFQKVMDWLIMPPGSFGEDPIAGRDALLVRSLEQAVDDVTERLGANMDRWRYGGADAFKYAKLRHPLSNAVNETMRRRLEVGPLPRGGYSYTVNQTGSGDNQTSGASFRIIVDTGNWDHTVGLQTPGQSGDPDSHHYSDTFELWANNRFFPVFYTRERVEEVAHDTWVLIPENN